MYRQCSSLKLAKTKAGDSRLLKFLGQNIGNQHPHGRGHKLIDPASAHRIVDDHTECRKYALGEIVAAIEFQLTCESNAMRST